MGKYIVENIKDFNLDHVFDCGQCFRWSKEADGSYTGIASGKIVNMSMASGNLIIDNATEEDFNMLWRDYLDLNRDYGKIKKSLKEKDRIIGDAIDYGYGIRLLRQEKWETLLSFIISQNNNIPRIKGCIETLAREFGQLAGEYREKTYYTLPTAEALAKESVESLASVHLGYRASYLVETAKAVVDQGGEEALEPLGRPEVSSQEAFETITRFKGVGPKVANCILLFSMNKYESFPIDVWVRRVMHRLYGMDEADKAAMAAYAAENFGSLGGFAQQYLFYYIRSLEG